MRPNKISRTYSDKFVAGSSDADLYQNKNVEWMTGRFTKLAYILLVLGCWFVLHVTGIFSKEDCWTVTNMVHGVITFVMFHWIKGCPDGGQGEYDHLTLYEQIDAGVPWTAKKKFLILVPTLLCLVACFFGNYQPIHVVVNVAIMLICVIGKLPQMHRVRIFGINSTPGIDEPIGYLPTTDSTGLDLDGQQFPLTRSGVASPPPKKETKGSATPRSGRKKQT